MSKKKPLQGKSSVKKMEGIMEYDIEDRNFLRYLHKVIDEIFLESSDAYDWTWNQLASRANLSYQTVQKLGMRETRWPHFKTIYKLAKAVGWHLELAPTKNKKGKTQLRVKRAA